VPQESGEPLEDLGLGSHTTPERWLPLCKQVATSIRTPAENRS